MVFPKESELFGQEKPTEGMDDATITPLEETDLYKKDDLGLKFLNDNGRLF